MLDRARFPRLAQYADTLPQGFASFPECRAKGSICRHLLEKHPVTGPKGLPDEIAAFVERPVPHSSWVSECACMGLHMAIGDAYGMEEAAYDRWLYDHNAGLLEGRFMFRSIMSLATPGVLMHGAAIRFNGFHQGTKLEITSRNPNAVEFQLGYPKGIYSDLCLAAFRAAFQVSLDMTQAKNLRCELAKAEPAMAFFRVSWEKWD